MMRIEDLVEPAIHHKIQLVEREADAVVGQAVLGEVGDGAVGRLQLKSPEAAAGLGASAACHRYHDCAPQALGSRLPPCTRSGRI